MKLLVTGSEGYVGYPLVLKLEKLGYDVIGVDNRSRGEWVHRITCGSEGLIRPETIVGNLTDRDFVDELLKLHKPNCIIHLASQPSMPYSQISWERALFTQLNNQIMNLNLLWGMKENNLLDTKYIVTTTTGVSGQNYSLVPEEMVTNFAGSWYHVSRGFDSENCNLAARQWNLRIIEFRTAIVYGLLTEELRESGLTSRFDTDYYFGTALNRFVAQAIKGEPLSVYGDGRQTKPFISLEDCVQSLANAVTFNFPKGHTLLNQTTESVSIIHLAKLISQETGAEIKHIPNPRVEKEDFEMRFENSKFLRVLGEPKQLIGEGVKEIIGTLKC